ncbi:SDR family NAD(P)-dependent oxidoreductase [Anaeromicrobium sediminis]|uniref:Oxidoreductase n=1 Tax=Anaeromicrobium sediminis TaxID=1478221 RepID=A0A267MHN6_9FIRM|nr:SDR family oxidoreductase [Anaeromicrobium sediminis]PAB59091.1 oxidoreductase [Anaeromicrobium sediminis]
MYEDLKRKRVVITGGASGIGLATVKRFVDEGAKVVIFDVNKKNLDEVLLELKNVQGILVDVSNESSVVNAFEQVDELLGGVDILISNAGISVRKSFHEITYEQWQKVININLGGMFLCARESIKRMIKEKTGVILFTGSTNGMDGHVYYADYNASKAGVINLAKTIALEYAPWLRVNVLSPGYVMTPMQKAEYTEEMFAEVNEGIPIKRHAEPEEIAALFAFLASNEASYITGQNIPIDGGETA